MRLQIAAHVEIGAAENFLLVEEQWDQHPPQAAIAVLEWMQRLELHMHDGQLHQRIQLSIAIHVGFPCIHSRAKLRGCNRHKTGLFNAAALGADVPPV